MENVKGWAEKEEYKSCLGQEKRSLFCIGTQFAEIFKFTSMCLSFISLDLQDHAPTPVLIRRPYWGGVNIEGELLHPDWQKLHDDICLSIMVKYKGRRMELGGVIQAKTIQYLKVQAKALQDLQCWVFLKFNVFWVFLLGRSNCIVLGSFVQKLPKGGDCKARSQICSLSEQNSNQEAEWCSI